MHQTKQYSQVLLPFNINCNIAQNHSLITVISRMMHICIDDLCCCILVGSNSLVNPAPQVGHTGIHCRGAHVAVGGTPGHNTYKGPHSAVLTDQRTTRVTLK